MKRNPVRVPPFFSDTDALLKLVPEQLPLFIYIYDLNEGRNIYANRRFTEVLGYEREENNTIGPELLGRILHPDDRHLVTNAKKIFANLKDREFIELEHRVADKLGKWYWFRSRTIVLSRMPDGAPHLLLGAALDISLQKEAESQQLHYRDQKEQEHQRLNFLLDLNERDRRLMAYDIHDGFVQDVVSAQLGIDNMLDDLAKSDPESVAPLLRVRGYIRKAIDEARRVVSELRPAATDDTGLVEAIQFLINEAEAAARIDVKFSYPQNFGRLPLLLERSLVRIVQESLNNIKRHAQTKEAFVRLSHTKGELRLEVEDQGVGFDTEAVPADRYGLEGIRERARVFGGSTSIESKRGKGTLVAVVIPLEEPSQARKPKAKNKRKKGAKRKKG